MSIVQGVGRRKFYNRIDSRNLLTMTLRSRSLLIGRVSTPPNVTLTTAANYTICSQRMLDPVFLEISNRHNSAINLTSWFYLGSVEGVQRSFPGRVSSELGLTMDTNNVE